jgi:hypothetical protein
MYNRQLLYKIAVVGYCYNIKSRKIIIPTQSQLSPVIFQLYQDSQ